MSVNRPALPMEDPCGRLLSLLATIITSGTAPAVAEGPDLEIYVTAASPPRTGV